MILETLVAGPMAAALAYAVGYSAWAGLKWPVIGRLVEVDGVRLHVVEGGDPASPELPVLMLHGASSNAREWLSSVCPVLGDRRWIAIDRPGLGRSDRPHDGHKLARQAGLAAGLLSELQIERAVVLAHSLGAATALRMALDQPNRVAGLVLAAPASHPYPGDNAWHVRLGAHPILGPAFVWTALPLFGPLAARAGVEATFAPATAPAGYAARAGLGLLFRPWTFAANARQVRATNREFAAQAPRYGEIEAPTIILTGDRDAVVSPKIHARALAAAIAGAELVAAPGVGHMPHQVRPDLVAGAVRRVCERARGTNPGRHVA
jgi:pimeloyl-ACP methyl ester carboxylesterase